MKSSRNQTRVQTDGFEGKKKKIGFDKNQYSLQATEDISPEKISNS